MNVALIFHMMIPDTHTCCKFLAVSLLLNMLNVLLIIGRGDNAILGPNLQSYERCDADTIFQFKMNASKLLY